VLEIKSVVRLLALFRHTAFLQLLQQTGLAWMWWINLCKEVYLHPS
jgi:hypothetical protein